ncbi:MAG: ATP-binding cassette domain-containing protein [Planctomycetota bacterium]
MQRPPSPAVRVQSVSKRYGTTLAVDEVSFELFPGEIVGFLGPNGAGKSTLLKMLSTWLPPTAGTIEVAGHDVVRQPDEVRSALGYLPEHNALYESMRVDRLIRFVAKVRGLRGAELAERVAWVVERCALGEVLAKRVQQCSKGFRQRIGVALALVHNPPVVLLDEPTHGLDPLQVVVFLDFLRSISADRVVLFSSHILSEVVAVSDRLLIIQRGRLLTDSPLAELQAAAQTAGETLEERLLGIVRERRAVTL